MTPATDETALAVLGTKVVMFGGVTSSILNANTYEFDGTAWTQKAPAHSPPARRSHAMSTLGSKVVLFGGYTSTSPYNLNDTWEWNGTDWTQRTPATSPSGRYGHGMATLGSKVVLFGGWQGSSNLVGDTWTWDGTNWTKQSPATSPSARHDFGMTTLGSKVVLFGGDIAWYGSWDNQTWEWDGTTWTQRFPGTSPPKQPPGGMGSVGSSAVLAFNWAGNSVSYAWDGANWADVSSPHVPASAIAAASTGNKVVAVAKGSAVETWIWDGTAWARRLPVKHPSAQTNAMMATVGPRTYLRGGVSGEFWDLTGGVWYQDVGAPLPFNQYAKCMAAAGSSLVLLGCYYSACTTYRFDGAAWSTGPSGTFQSPSCASVGDSAILADQNGSTPSAWSWDGAAWNTIAAPAITSGFSWLTGVGASAVGSANGPIWTWDGNAWSSKTPSTNPSINQPEVAAVGTSVLELGEDGSGAFKAWEWDGTAWSPLSQSSTPPARYAFGLATTGTGVVMFGGAGTSSALDDTWVTTGVITAGAPCAVDADCYGGSCEGGVCCDTACTGTCKSCRASKTGLADGVCGNIKANTDPDSECTMLGSGTCQTSGLCNGNGACQSNSGTECVPGSCAGTTVAVNPRKCNASGACVAGTTTDCAPYICEGVACRTTCSLDSQCQSGYFCDGGKCSPVGGQGQACTADAQCPSGHCVGRRVLQHRVQRHL